MIERLYEYCLSSIYATVLVYENGIMGCASIRGVNNIDHRVHSVI